MDKVLLHVTVGVRLLVDIGFRAPITVFVIGADSAFGVYRFDADGPPETVIVRDSGELLFPVVLLFHDSAGNASVRRIESADEPPSEAMPQGVN